MGVLTVISPDFIEVTMEISYKSLLFFLKSNVSVFLFFFKNKFQKCCGWEYELLGKENFMATPVSTMCVVAPGEHVDAERLFHLMCVSALGSGFVRT